MIPYARLRPGPGFAPGKALLYYAQRVVTLPPARRFISSVISGAVRLMHGAVAIPSVEAGAAGALADLAEHGVAMLSPLLADAAVARMLAYFLDQPVVAPDGGLVPLERLAPGAATADYPLRTALDCPGMMELLNAPAIMQLCTQFLGCKPTVSSLGVRWSFPGAGRTARTQEFHRDLDDWRFLKLFVYLTDVDHGSGPHTYVRGSHKTAFSLKAKAYSRSELDRRFGPDSFLSIVGPRGTTFIADTLGVHRGDAPAARPRLVLQAQYSLLPIFAFDYAPVLRTDLGFDGYSNRLLVRDPEGV